MSERVRGAVAGVFAALACACLVPGTLGRYTAGEQATQATQASTSEADVTGGEACPRVEPGPCASCLADFCCEELSACEGGVACACMFECLTGGAVALECVTRCGAGAVSMQFSVCTAKNCAPVCSPG